MKMQRNGDGERRMERGDEGVREMKRRKEEWRGFLSTKTKKKWWRGRERKEGEGAKFLAQCVSV